MPAPSPWPLPGLTPRLPPGCIPRPRLEALAGAAVVVLEGGPGAGKTVALLGLAAAREAPVVWLTLEPDGADAAAIARRLVAGIRAHVPPFGDELAPLLASGKQEPRLLARELLGALAAYSVPRLTLVVDDAHHAGEAAGAFLRALWGLADCLPDGLALLAASRRRLGGALLKAEAAGLAVRLGASDLAFDDAEVAALFQARWAGEGVPVAWWAAAERLAGWPLGLALLTRQPAGVGVVPTHAALASYVREEWLGSQPVHRREALVGLAWLEPITAEACREVLGLAEAEDLLAALADDGLLVALSDGRTHRWPPVLREVLRQEAEALVPRARQVAWHRKAAAFHEDRNEWEAAWPHLLALEAWERVERACASCFPTLAAAGRRAAVDRWLAEIPAPVLEAHPSLVMWRGHGHARAGRLAQALADYGRARELASRRGDIALAFGSLVREATLLALHGRLPEAGQRLMQAHPHAGQGQPADVADFHLARVLVAEARGDAALVAACNQAVLAVPGPAEPALALRQATAHQNLVGAALLRGEVDVAQRHLATAEALAERHGLLGTGLYARCLRAQLQVLVGEVEAAARWETGLPPHWEAALDPVEAAVAWVVRGELAQARGEAREAESLFRRGLEAFAAIGFSEGVKVAVERLMALAVARRHPERALEWLAEVGPGERRTLHDLALGLPQAGALLQLDRPAEAGALLAELAPALEASEAWLRLAQAGWLLAAACLAQGDEAGARQALEEADAVAVRQGLGWLAVREPWLVARLLPLRSTPGPVPASAAPAEAPVLEIRCLGPFVVRLAGAPLDGQLRRKTKLILAALAVQRRGLTLDGLAECLGLQALTPATVRTLHTDVFELRRVLEPARGKREASRFLQLTDERYHLMEDGAVRVDLWEHGRLMAEGDALRGRDPDAALARYEAAFALARGGLLDEGGFSRHFEPEREAHRRHVLAALAWVAATREAAGQREGAEEALRQAVALAPVDEATHLALLAFLHRSGQPGRAEHAYWECRKALKQRLGMEPSREFEAAARPLRSPAPG